MYDKTTLIYWLNQPLVNSKHDILQLTHEIKTLVSVKSTGNWSQHIKTNIPSGLNIKAVEFGERITFVNSHR